MSDCPVTSCGISVPRDKLMCRAHWYSISRELRDDLWAAIRTHGSRSREAALARGECIRAANQLESRGTLEAAPPGAAEGQAGSD